MDLVKIDRRRKVHFPDPPFDNSYIHIDGQVRVTPLGGKSFDYPIHIDVSNWVMLGENRPAYSLHFDEVESHYNFPYQETTLCVVGHTYILNQEAKEGLADTSKHTVLRFNEDSSYTLLLKGDTKNSIKFSPAVTPKINAVLTELYKPYR